MKYKLSHPYAISAYIYSFSAILIIPIIQQLIFKPYNIYTFTLTFWKSILLNFLLLLWALLKYRSIKYSVFDKKIFIKHGVFSQNELSIPFESIHAINVRNKIFQSIFGAVKIVFDLSIKNKNAELVLSKEEALTVLRLIFSFKNKKTIYKARTVRIILMSAFWANPLTSLLIFIPFVHRVGSILGEEISAKLYSAVDIRLILIAIGISPLIATVIYLFVLAFLIAFIIQLFRYSNFKAGATKECIFISRGMINKNKKIIKKSKINAVSVTQTLFMKALNLSNAYIHTINFTKNEDDKTLLIAASESAKLIYDLEEIIPIKIISKKGITPAKNTIKRFIFMPSLCLFILIFFMFRLKEEIWYTQIISLFLKLILLFLIWWFFLRIQGYKISGIALSENIIKISGYKKLTLFNSYIPIEKVQSIQIRRNPFQIAKNLANIRIYIFSEKEKYFSCNHLKYEYVKNFVENVENNSNFQGFNISILD